MASTRRFHSHSTHCVPPLSLLFEFHRPRLYELRNVDYFLCWYRRQNYVQLHCDQTCLYHSESQTYENGLDFHNILFPLIKCIYPLSVIIFTVVRLYTFFGRFVFWSVDLFGAFFFRSVFGFLLILVSADMTGLTLLLCERPFQLPCFARRVNAQIHGCHFEQKFDGQST